MTQPRTRISATVLGSPEPRALADFYARLLGWPITYEEPGWVMLKPPGGGTGLSFQHEPDHVPPVWPPQTGAQQMMLHLDIGVDDLANAVTWALEGGATLASTQPEDDVRVLLDPDGHPFCLFLAEF
ncbi:VOC family protein [Amycolatopsis pittospori]|uniref:VOC family protein n=1 Tax=Amycolatopsis pittospori TaxID=2749434 RepID=UPI0015F03D3D|nr:VOC family protein [Amycolatopsis pittospori]